MKHFYILTIAFFSVLFSEKVSAQAPANDDCSGAISLTVATSQSAAIATVGFPFSVQFKSII